MPKKRKGWRPNSDPQRKTRYGCFLPNLTGLARLTSTADLQLLYRLFRLLFQGGLMNKFIAPPLEGGEVDFRVSEKTVG